MAGEVLQKKFFHQIFNTHTLFFKISKGCAKKCSFDKNSSEKVKKTLVGNALFLKNNSYLFIKTMYLEDLRKSVFSLAKYNNGRFKSEKQKEFLTKVLKRNHGYLGDISTYGNITSFFAEWDEEGITKITKQHKKSGREIVNFKRKDDKEHQKDVEKRLLSQKKHYEEIRDRWNKSVKETINELRKIVKKTKGLSENNPTNELYKSIYDEFSEKLELHERELDYLPEQMPSWWIYEKERRLFYNLGVEIGLEKRIYSDKRKNIDENVKRLQIYISESIYRKIKV